MQAIQKIGPYEILHELGQGALAVVYAAHDPALKRQVALKVLHPIFSKNLKNIERLKQEAQTLAQLKHPNIIHIYEFIDEPDVKGIVTEYIEGQTLAQFLDQHSAVSPEISAVIITDILSALEHAHSKRIIHRDIKPQNIIISAEGQVKLADFSIAKIMDKECLTLTGQLIGSPFFMSPEQANGEKVDERSDIFTTGILLYNLITGRLPFVDEDQKVILKKILETSFERPRKLNPEISEKLETIVLKALSKDKEKRYQKAWEFRYDLLKYLQHQDIPHEEISLKEFFKNPKQFTKDFKLKLIDLLFKKAKTAFEKKNYGEASQRWNQILDYDPQNKQVQEELKKLSMPKRLKKAKRVAMYSAPLFIIGGIALYLNFDKQPLTHSPIRYQAPDILKETAENETLASPAIAKPTQSPKTPLVQPTISKTTTSEKPQPILSKWAYLQINMDPDTEFYLDGKKIMTDKVNPVPLKPGTHTVQFKKRGFRDIKTTVVLKEGETSTINIRRGS